MVLRAGLQAGLLNQSSAQVIDGSLRFDDAKNNRLERTVSDGNRRTFTFACWVKRGVINATPINIFAAGSNNFRIALGAGAGYFQVYNYNGSSHDFIKGTSSLYRDTGWYHLVVAIDTTDGTAADRMKLYVNGERLTTFGNGNTNPSENFQSYVNDSSNTHYLGYIGASGYDLDAYLSQAYFIDGLALGPENFGFTDPLTGTWRPKKYTGSFAGPAFGYSGTIPTSTTDVPPAGSYGNGIATAALLFGGTILTNGQNHIRQDGGGIEWSAAIPLSNGDVAGAQCLYFNNTSTHAIEFKIDGNWVTVQSNAQNVIGSTQGQGALITYTASGSVSWTGVRAAGGSNISVTTVAGIFVNGELVGPQTTPPNGFYLPMDGNTPIGKDQSGNGNDFTPVNFGGSTNSLDKATGALPILNTVSGGNYATPSTRTDSNASSVIFAAPLIDGAIDVSNQINSGSTTKSGTLSGATSESVSNFYGKSLVFDGSNDSISYTNQSEFVMGTSDFTMECWVYVHGTGSERTVFGLKHTGGSGWTGYKFYINTSAAFIFYAEDAGSGGWDVGLSAGNNTINVNRWQHLAVTRSGNTFRIFVDGVLKNSTTSSVDLNDTGSGFYIGQNGYDQQWMDGNIQDVRIYKGVAKYTSDFVPASSNPNILPDTPSGVSGGSKLTKITDGAVAFDGTGDELKVSDSGTDFQFGTGDFTVEAFVYYNVAPSSSRYIIDLRSSAGTDNAGSLAVGYTGDNSKLEWAKPSSNAVLQVSWADYFGAKTWNHIAVARSGSTIKMFINGKEVDSATDSTNYIDPADITIGDRYTNSNATQYFDGFISNVRIVKGTALYTSNFTPSTAPLTNVTNTKLLCCQSNTSALAAAVSPSGTTVWSESVTPSNTSTQFPIERGFDGVITGDGGTSGFAGWLAGAGNITITFPSGVSVSNAINIYHGDGLNGSTTASITVDGTTTTSSASSGYVTTKSFTGVSGNLESITLTQAGGGVRFYGIAIDGTVLKDPLAVNGDAAATNFNPFNTDINTVRGQETGYATMNPLDNESFTLTDGNLNVTNMGSARQVHANIFVNSGKWYAEFTCKAAMNDTLFGVANVNGTSFLGSDTNSWGVISINGNRIHDQNGSGGQSSYGSSFTAGDVISVALDMDSGKWYAAKNGVYFGGGNPLTGANPAHSGLTGDLTFAVGSNSANGDVSCNFGQKPFKFPPPDGFQLLNATNIIPETVIARPDQYFNITEWSGNNADPRQINLGMAADMIWVKTRNQTNWHWVSDSLRGTADKRYKLYPNDPSAEDTAPIYGQADSFNDFGFVAGGGTNDAGEHLSDSNKSGTNYICYSWKAGGSKFTYNKNGDGGSSASDIGVSATTLTLTGATINTRSKFGIYTYTGSGSGGATLNHGLGGTPGLVIYKKRTGSSSWQVYHQSLGGTQYMTLDENVDAYTSDSTRFGGNNATSSTISLGTHANGATTVVLYAWCDVPGLQKFGTYNGNSNADGAYVELGFRPALLWIKRTDNGSTGNWVMLDTTRNSSNPVTTSFYADTNDQDYVPGQNWADILSNGFKIRATYGEVNVGSYIYCAWAEAPSFNLYGGQSNAR